MRIFVTGATGYIGSCVCDALKTAGHQVVGLSRSAESDQKLEVAGVEPLRGDLASVQSFSEAVAGNDGVIHAALAQDANSALYETAAVEMILEVLEGSSRPFIYTSDVRVMGNTGHKPVGEDAPLDPIPLVSYRAALEQKVLEAGAFGVRGIVIRPAMVYGRGRGFLSGMFRSVETLGAVQYVGDGNNLWSTVHVDDLARLYVLALEKAPPGTLLIAAHGKPLRVREIAEAVASAATPEAENGRPAKKIAVTSVPLAEAENTIGPFVHGLVLDQCVSGDRAKQLGWEPRHSGVPEEIRTHYSLDVL